MRTPAALACILLACGGSGRDGGSGTGETTAPRTRPEAGPVATAAPDAAAAAPAPAIPATADADARALIAAWVTAQNSADFAAYERLYAADFRGVQRVGDQVRELDRAGWLASRKKMLARTPRVAADDLVVQPAAARVVVSFTQRWSASGYADHGEKQMSLAYDDTGKLRIAREELLSSKPGWEELSADRTVDATGLPRSIAMWVGVSAGKKAGPTCYAASFSLHLDAGKQSVDRDIGRGFVFERLLQADRTVEPDDPREGGWLYSDIGRDCGDAGNHYAIKKHGDTLVVVDRTGDEDGEGKTLFVVNLPAKAKLDLFDNEEAYYQPGE